MGQNEIERYAGAILNDPRFQKLRSFEHHGPANTVYDHSLAVTRAAYRIACALHLSEEETASVVRAALLHDFFMYNWNDPASMRPLHGFTHAREALCNAQKQFELNEIERDVIKKHMFPLNIALPRYRETALVSAADKISAVMELLHSARALRILRRCRAVGL